MYEPFYHLHGKPFRLTPDAAMLFPSKGHTRAMSYLMYGFEQGEGFVMITGAVGTGKTLLIQKLTQDLSERHIAMASIASANLDGDDILPAVAAEFELPYEGRSKEALLQDLKRHLRMLNTDRVRALLVVDEAQTLTAEALEMLRILSNFERNGRALLQVFLVGQTELRNIIVSHHLEQLRQRIITSYRLQPMEMDECRAYILYRLQAVGWDDDPIFAPAVFAGVHRASRGIPRKVNLIMDRLLLYGYLEELHSLDQAALTVVLDEMREEMGGDPQTLEPVVEPSQPAPAAAPVSEPVPQPEVDLEPERESQLEADAPPEPQPPLAAEPEPKLEPQLAADSQPRLEPRLRPEPQPPQPREDSADRERDLAALELKCNHMLLRLMREEVRLKRMLESEKFTPDAGDEAMYAEIRALRGGRNDA